MNRMKIIVIVVCILLCVALIGSAVASAASVMNDGLEDSGDVSNFGYGPDFNKPPVSDISGIEKYPDEITSSAEPEIKEKEWYEYIAYSDTAVGELVFSNFFVDIFKSPYTKVVFYDPFDYSYGMIMDTGKNLLTGFSSSNIVDISYTQKENFSVAASFSTTWTNEFYTEACAKITQAWPGGLAEASVKVSNKLTLTIGTQMSTSYNIEESRTISKTFNATHFNSAGTVLQWRVIDYAVYLPLRCDVYKYVNGEWVYTAETFYCLLSTVEGLCRQWIQNGIVYMEHWGTGAPVTVDDFWQGFFTKDALKDAYKNSALPVSR